MYVYMNRGSVSTISIGTNESTPILWLYNIIDTEIRLYVYIPITYHCYCILIVHGQYNA